MERVKETLMEYSEARTRLIKSFRKLNYRVGKLKGKKFDMLKYGYKAQKDGILKELRRMDRILREIMER